MGVQFGYAVLANWEGPDPENHPSNAQEAVAVSVMDDSSLWMTGGDNFGGKFDFDFSLYGWHGQPSAMSLESGALETPYQFSPTDMIPTWKSD
ncbi:MAG TPA: hypothetical protein VGB30_14430 [bacterium]